MIVVFEDTGEERSVRDCCRRCYHRGERIESMSTPDVEIVSASGLAHLGAENGMTYCGKDATRDGWWWRY